MGKISLSFSGKFGRVTSSSPNQKRAECRNVVLGAGPFPLHSILPLSPPPLHYFLSETEACLRKISPSSLPRRRPSKSPNLEGRGGERKETQAHTEGGDIHSLPFKGEGREVYSSPSSRSPLRSRLRRLCKPPKYTREFLVPNRVPPSPSLYPLLHGM